MLLQCLRCVLSYSVFAKNESEMLKIVTKGLCYSTSTNELRILAYMNAKYYIINGHNRMHIRGNQLAEAVAGGALIVGDLSVVNNGHIFSSPCVKNGTCKDAG